LNIAQDMPPNHLYKYRWFDKNRIDGVPYQRDRSIIVDCALWAASPREFNDPFDCYPVTDFQGTVEEIESWAKNVALKEGITLLNPVEAINNALNIPEAREQMADWRKKLDAIGVLCLSEQSDDMLMWSHYASSHKGYCLEFDATIQPFSSEAVRVHYAKERSIFRIFDPNQVDNLKRAMLRKADFWQYEHEWRIVRPAEFRTVEFSPPALKSIIFGAAIEKKDEDELRVIAAKRETPVAFKRARLHQSNYQVEIVEA
jgi:Protein of unknown function (DUF2971)